MSGLMRATSPMCSYLCEGSPAWPSSSCSAFLAFQRAAYAKSGEWRVDQRTSEIAARNCFITHHLADSSVSRSCVASITKHGDRPGNAGIGTVVLEGEGEGGAGVRRSKSSWAPRARSRSAARSKPRMEYHDFIRRAAASSSPHTSTPRCSISPSFRLPIPHRGDSLSLVPLAPPSSPRVVPGPYVTTPNHALTPRVTVYRVATFPFPRR